MEGQATTTGHGIGEALRTAREALQLTLRETAEQLHLDPRVVDDLECERFDALGAPVYMRGHLRRYALWLELDADELQRRFDERTGLAVLPDLTQAPRALPQPDPRRFLWPAVIIAGLAVLGGILWWALNATPA